MDSVDRAILAELQADGRLTVTELADRVRLTPGPCHRRLRELERSGVITGYRALVNPAAVGMGFEALVQITLERGDAGTVAAFEAAVTALPQVRHAERLFGDPDYLLWVAARDLDDFAALRDQKQAAIRRAMPQFRQQRERLAVRLQIIPTEHRSHLPHFARGFPYQSALLNLAPQWLRNSKSFYNGRPGKFSEYIQYHQKSYQCPYQ